MKAKRTRKPGKRRTNDGKKSALSEIEMQLNKSAASGAAGDEYWQITITITSQRGDELVSMLVRPPWPPPPPPFTPDRIRDWARPQIGRAFGFL